MNISTVLDRLVTLESGLAITSPLVVPVRRVFKYAPNRQQALADLPCWINTWTLSRIDWTLSGTTARRQEYYSVNAQLFVEDADLNRGAEIASAFLPQFLSAVGPDFTLSGDALFADVRGGDPTLGLLEWAGKGYAGLNLFVDIEIQNP